MDAIWLATFTALLTLIGILLFFGYMNFNKRLNQAEVARKFIISAMLEMNITLHPDQAEVITKIMRQLLKNGE